MIFLLRHLRFQDVKLWRIYCDIVFLEIRSDYYFGQLQSRICMPAVAVRMVASQHIATE